MATAGPLISRLPCKEPLDAFIAYATEQGLALYPHQEEAILELYSGKNLILNTPTGSGKSLVATAVHFESLANGRRSVYTAPIKALVNEKFLALCRDFGPDNVGLLTGDASVNRDAPILCCTAEILANFALCEGPGSSVRDVIMDEFHFYSDRERGVAWQVPLLEMPQTRFLLMSATLGDTSRFEKCLTELNGLETVVIRSVERPVPLDFSYRETTLEKTVSDLVVGGKAPIYLVNFTQRACAETAQSLMSTDFATRDEKKAIAEAISGRDFSSPYGKEVSRLIRHGIGLHHAGLLPKYRVLIESLAQKGLLKIICGTDTLGVGVNVPIRTVLFTQLCKFDGQKTGTLSVRDFKQIAGRAGRRGFDTQGYVVVQAPEHVIENIKIDEKIRQDPSKAKKLVKRKPPEKGYVPWDKATMQKLIDAEPEALVSRFKVDHAMVLQVLSRPGDGCRQLRSLISRSHETEASQRRWKKNAFQLFRSLVDRGIIELLPSKGQKIRLNLDLQEDFSLMHALALYLVDTIELIEPTSPTRALDILSLVESIIEDPDVILRKQLDRIKTEKMAEMKAEGIEFEQRLEELEKLEHPKPNREFTYATFNDFAKKHPWIGQDNIRPKSVAREMFENFHSFSEYIREYDLHRSEGLLLRYISEVYKILAQTVPDPDKDDELRAIEAYFGSLVRSTDSSLLEEWDRLRFRADAKVKDQTSARIAESVPLEVDSQNLSSQGAFDITRDTRSFARLLRNEAHRLLRCLSRGDWDGFLDSVDHDPDWDLPRLKALAHEYTSDHSAILLDPQARHPKWTQIHGDRLTQTLVDPEGHNDWEMELKIDQSRSRELHRPVLRILRLSPIGAHPNS